MMAEIDIDLILFFKYLDGLKREKSVKSLSFKLEKHPTTIRRMIKKVEDFFHINLVIYENYQCIITDQGYKFLDKYYELNNDITIQDLFPIVHKPHKNMSVIINKEFYIPYILHFIDKNNIQCQDITIKNDFTGLNFPSDMTIKNNVSSTGLIFSDEMGGDYCHYINLFFFKHKELPMEEIVIHENIYNNLKKILDFSLFQKILVVNNLSIMNHFIMKKNYSFIGYNNFIGHQEAWNIKPLNLSLNLWSNYDQLLKNH
jgi:hypothetical protein